MNKKIFAAAVFAALSAPVFADPGFYIQGDAGVSRLKAKDNEGFSTSKSGFSPRITVGYDFGNNWRGGVDYTHYTSIKYNYTRPGVSENGKAKFQSIGVSALYDFPVSEKVKPYLGARAGINHFSDKYAYSSAASSLYRSKKETKTGVGVLAGVGVNVTDNIALDAGYRYNYWGKYESSTKVHTNEFSAGVRVKF
ncbi:opacity family porin [Neisseria musculi]|uniref:Outer membrane autotransporter barrel domain protein n=1 Tax=Neisseria musculi TaxID=1815583 RepID=A0A7H1MCR5_9NEIS|nr:opacity family porin [Neisseria musculi]QNT59430.1 outer membrane autotransporter barrel domain protein [Neisseria musculi]